jgi:hypothetical protein
MTENTKKIIIPVPFPAAPLIVKFRILGLYCICKSCKKDISGEYHTSLAFVGTGSTLAPLLANIAKKGILGEES